MQAAGRVGMFERHFHTEEDRLGREQALLNSDGFEERRPSLLGCRAHDAQERAPIHHPVARQMSGVGVEQTDFVRCHQHETCLVDAPSPGASEHLEDFVGLERVFEFIAPVRFAGEGDAAKGEIDARGQAHGGYDRAKLSRLGQGLDHSGARPVAEAAVVEGDAGLEQAGEVIAHDLALGDAQLQRIRARQVAGQVSGEGFRRLAARGEHQHGAQVVGERLRDRAWPVASNLGWQIIIEVLDMDFFKRNGAVLVADQVGVASQTPQPLDHVLRIADAAAQQQELCGGRGQGDGQLVVEPAVGVPDHLVFIDDEQAWAGALHQAVLLCFERGDEDRRVEILGQVARGDADVPPARPPLGQFVVRQRACRNGIDRLAPIMALLGPDLENQCLARTGRRLDDDVTARTQGADRFLLPEVGHDHLVQGGQAGQLIRERLHALEHRPGKRA